MTIQDLTRRFLVAQEAVQNINCALLAGKQKVEIEQLRDRLADIWVEIEGLSHDHKHLTIVNYQL